MNNIQLKNKLDKELKQEYLNFFNIKNINAYTYFTPLENEIRIIKFIGFFENKKEYIKFKKHKQIKEYLLIKLCNEKIENLNIKLNIIRSKREEGIYDFSNINKLLVITGSNPSI